jgi:hypothetical protein
MALVIRLRALCRNVALLLVIGKVGGVFPAWSSGDGLLFWGRYGEVVLMKILLIKVFAS